MNKCYLFLEPDLLKPTLKEQVNQIKHKHKFFPLHKKVCKK